MRGRLPVDAGEVVGESARRAVQLDEAPRCSDPVEIRGIGLPLAELGQEEDLARSARLTAGPSAGTPRRPRRDMPRQERPVVLVGAQQDPGPIRPVLVAERAGTHRLENQQPLSRWALPPTIAARRSRLP